MLEATEVPWITANGWCVEWQRSRGKHSTKKAKDGRSVTTSALQQEYRTVDNAAARTGRERGFYR